jgi:uncharacterized protein YkwD
MPRPQLAIALAAALLLASPPAEARRNPRAHDSRWAAYLAPVGRCGSDTPIVGMACLINWARVRRGLPPLRTVPALESVAQAKLRAVVDCGELSHTPCGRSLVSFFRDAGYLGGRRWLVGENIAMVSGAPAAPRAVMRAWLYSTEHRANIFVRRFRDQGVGVIHLASFAGAADVTLWTSEFGRRDAGRPRP